MSRSLPVAAAAIVAGGVLGEKRLLNQLAATDPPPGWRTPEWRSGVATMVPTDDGAELLVQHDSVITESNDRPIVFVPGLSGDHHSWSPIARLLAADGHTVVGLNQRGHGGSTIGTEGFGADRQGRDVGQVLLALDLHDVVLVGHSMGGVAGLSLLAGRHPGSERVAAMVAVSTLASSVRPDRNLLMRLQLTRLYERFRRDNRHAAVVARYVFGPPPSRAMVDDVLAMARRCPTATVVGATRGLIDYDIRDRLADIDVPMTVVCGTRDLITTHAENEEISEAIPGARFVSISGAGHMVIWERPEAVASVIEQVTRSRRDPDRASAP